MPGLEIPPWIQPADPAAHMARGLQIGVQIGSEQAADRFRQMQMARDQEEFAQKQALADQAFQLERQQRQEEAKQAAMKMQAQLQYQQAVQEGMDPLKALVQFGVAAGQNVGPVATAMRSMANEQAMQERREHPPIPQVIDLGNGIKGVQIGSDFKFFPKETPEMAQGPVQGQPVLDPVSKQPLPNLVAVPSATGRGWDYKLTKPPSEMTPAAAAGLAGRLPDLEGTFPGISTNLGPQLIDYVKQSLPLRKGKEAKPALQVLPFPKSKDDAVVGQVYQTKVGPRKWDGKHFIEIAAPPPAEVMPQQQSPPDSGE